MDSYHSISMSVAQVDGGTVLQVGDVAISTEVLELKAEKTGWLDFI